MGGDRAEKVRAFVALDLEPASLRRVGRVADRLRMGSGAPSATWTPHAKMHVTLKFLGEVGHDAVVALGEGLRPLAEGKLPPSPCGLRLSAFPSPEEARIVVAELVDELGEIAILAAKVEKLAAKAGIARVPEGTGHHKPVLREERPYRPHVTLARLKRPYDARRWLRPELTEGLAPCHLTHVTLYRSELLAEGAEYVPLARVAFD
jgi:2'-5' RNA ligase